MKKSTKAKIYWKRDLSPICIPPSWDLVQKYAGALDENADGFDKELYEKGRRNYVGDQGEAEFLDLMRNLEIGGILNWRRQFSTFIIWTWIEKIAKKNISCCRIKSSSRWKKVQENNLIKIFFLAKDFQFDFLYFNSQIGLIHIEVKRDQKYTMEKIFEYSSPN